MTDSDAVGSVAKKRKIPETLPSIAPSGGHEYSTSYAHTLYLLGISPLNVKGKVPSAPDHPEVSNLVLATSDLPSLSTFMKKRMLKFKPNEATFVIFLCRCLFLPKMSDEPDVMMLHEFSGPFKSHDLHELVRGDQAIKYPLVKRYPFKEEPDVLQTLAATDLRSRSDFVFAVSTNCFGQRFRHDIEMTARDFPIPGLSNDLLCCAVAIVAEAKPDSSPASVTAARNQWSSLAYLHMMERVSISREETYVGDEDICQYGYGICGLQVSVWKMGLQWNSSKGRKSEVLEKYFTFPVQIVGRFNLEHQKHLEQFIEIHKAILRWWLGRYVTSYVRDVTNNLYRHPDQPEKWRTTWQEAVANCGCLVTHLPVFLLTLAHSQPWRGPRDRRVRYHNIGRGPC